MVVVCDGIVHNLQEGGTRVDDSRCDGVRDVSLTGEGMRLAVLIDAENAQLSILAELLAEIAKIGSATVKRVYGAQ